MKDIQTTIFDMFKPLEREPPGRNWPLYNYAQSKEKLIAMRILHEAVNCLDMPYGYKGNGRPPEELHDILKCMVIKVYNNFSNRRAIPDMHFAKAMGFISKIPHYNTISNYMKKPEIEPYLHELYKLIAMPVVKVEDLFCVDATGFGTFRKRWVEVRLQKKEHMDFKKLHMISGVRTNIITCAEVSDGRRHDSPYFEHLVKSTAAYCNVKEVSADAGYLSRDNCKAVVDIGAIPFIMPKKNTLGNAKGSMAWSNMMIYWENRRELFKQHYHQRSNAESTFSSMKRKFLPYLRAKSDEGQFNELLCKVVCHNLSVLVTAIMELGIQAEFTREMVYNTEVKE